MQVTIKKGKAYGIVQAPPSKSYSHRHLIMMALAGKGVVKNIVYNDDINATLDCLQHLGFMFEKKYDSVEFKGEHTCSYNPILDCKESGSTLRMIIPLAMTRTEKCRFTGSKQLLSRGIHTYIECLPSHGLSFSQTEDMITVEGKLTPGTFSVNGSVSSQFISGLMIALPLLEENSQLNILPPISSKSYIQMTYETSKEYGIEINREQNGQSYYIPGNQKYEPHEAIVEADESNSAFIDALNYMGGTVVLRGLKEQSTQGDSIYHSLFPLLSQEFGTVDVTDCIDLGPILMVFGAVHKGVKLTGSSRLRTKESDRVMAMKEELEKVGVIVEEGDDEVTVYPTYKPNSEVKFDAHNDHRVLMSLCVLSAYQNVTINQAECVNKSFPDFYKKLLQLGLRVEAVHEEE